MGKERVKPEEAEMRKGPWLEDEDEALITAISVLGERRWESLAKTSGLRRSGKSCRLRWMNYLRPNLKHGCITQQEEALIIRLHKQWGNRWSRIARSLPGRTDNEIKNYWRSHLRKKPHVAQQAVELSFNPGNGERAEKLTAGKSDQDTEKCEFDNGAKTDKLTSTSLDGHFYDTSWWDTSSIWDLDLH